MRYNAPASGANAPAAGAYAPAAGAHALAPAVVAGAAIGAARVIAPVNNAALNDLPYTGFIQADFMFNSDLKYDCNGLPQR